MEPNGLQNRDREAKIGRWVMYVCPVFSSSPFSLHRSPLHRGLSTTWTAEPTAIDFYSVEGWGSAGNQPDGSGSGGDPHDEGNHFAWSELNPYAGFIYALVTLTAPKLNVLGNSMEINSVCVRDIGIFAGLFLGALVFTQRGWNRWTVRTPVFSLIPDAYLATTYKNNRRTMVWIACGTLLCLPLIADGFLQLLTSYESTNMKRVLTGIPFGLGLGILVCSMFAARADAFHGAGQVLLPGDAKFTLSKASASQESE